MPCDFPSGIQRRSDFPKESRVPCGTGLQTLALGFGTCDETRRRVQGLRKVGKREIARGARFFNRVCLAMSGSSALGLFAWCDHGPAHTRGDKRSKNSPVNGRIGQARDRVPPGCIVGWGMCRKRRESRKGKLDKRNSKKQLEQGQRHTCSFSPGSAQLAHARKSSCRLMGQLFEFGRMRGLVAMGPAPLHKVESVSVESVS